MPVDTRHSSSQDSLDIWQTACDVLDGGEVGVKRNATRYVPMLPEQEPDEYDAYVKRGVFFNVSGRTLEALMGFIFRKPATIKTNDSSESMNGFIKDASLIGRGFPDFLYDTAGYTLKKGWHVTVVDFNVEENQPYVIHFEAPDVVNWQMTRIKGRMQLSRLILHELDSKYVDLGDGEKAPDKYVEMQYHQWREYELVPDGVGNYFMVLTIWRRRKTSPGTSAGARPKAGSRLPGTGPAKLADGDENFVAIDTIIPERGGFTLPFIPAIPHSTKGPVWEVSRSILDDMIALNLSMFRNSVDLENVRHVLGVPTPWFAGFTDDEDDEIHFGTTRAIVTNEVNASCGMLSVKGDDILPLKEAIEEKERQCAALGARMLDQQNNKNGPEAFATVALRQTGETSVLMKVVEALTQSLTKVIALAEWWLNRKAKTPEDLENTNYVQLNKDFISEQLDGPTLQALFQMFLQGGLSFESYVWNLKQGERIPPDTEIEDERRQLESTGEMLMNSAANQMQMQLAQMAQKALPEKKKKGSKAKTGQPAPAGG